MKHHAAAEIKKELEGKTVKDRLEYWNNEYKKQKAKQLQKLGSEKDE
jgi:hypothetical protein